MPSVPPVPPVPPFTSQDKLNCQQALRDLANAAAILPKCTQCGIDIADIEQEILTRIKMLEGIEQQFMQEIP